MRDADLDPSGIEAVVREIARDLYTAESECGHNETQTLVSMHLGLNAEGLSASAIASATSRDRHTIRNRLKKMAESGLVKRTGNVWVLTDAGVDERRSRFNDIWARLPQATKDAFRRESEYRRGAMPRQ